jgi:hypothetical protein
LQLIEKGAKAPLKMVIKDIKNILKKLVFSLKKLIFMPVQVI